MKVNPETIVYLSADNITKGMYVGIEGNFYKVKKIIKNTENNRITFKLSANKDTTQSASYIFETLKTD